MVLCKVGIKVWWAVWVILSHLKKTNRTFFFFSFFSFFYTFVLDLGRGREKKKNEAAFQRASWHKSCSLFFFFFFRETQRIWRQNKGKNKITKRSPFCIQNNLFRWCCFLVVALLLFFFPFLWWTTRHCRIGYTTCLPCLWMWNYSDTHSSFRICLRRFYLLTSSQAKQSTQKVPFCILQAPT